MEDDNLWLPPRIQAIRAAATLNDDITHALDHLDSLGGEELRQLLLRCHRTVTQLSLTLETLEHPDEDALIAGV